MNKKFNVSIYFFLISLTLFLYLIFFLIPYANTYGFFSENITPQVGDRLRYLFLNTPISIGYFLFT